MPLYETIVITRQDLNIDDADSLVEKLSKIVTDNGGKLVSKEYWGLRDLAYKIKKNTKGHYILFNIDAESKVLDELNRIIGFNEDIIRTATYEVDQHESQSYLAVARSPKDFKTGKLLQKRDTTDLESILSKIQIEG